MYKLKNCEDLIFIISHFPIWLTPILFNLHLRKYEYILQMDLEWVNIFITLWLLWIKRDIYLDLILFNKSLITSKWEYDSNFSAKFSILSFTESFTFCTFKVYFNCSRIIKKNFFQSHSLIFFLVPTERLLPFDAYCNFYLVSFPQICKNIVSALNYSQ